VKYCIVGAQIIHCGAGAEVARDVADGEVGGGVGQDAIRLEIRDGGGEQIVIAETAVQLEIQGAPRDAADRGGVDGHLENGSRLSERGNSRDQQSKDKSVPVEHEPPRQLGSITLAY
jgi:hypothetical protein